MPPPLRSAVAGAAAALALALAATPAGAADGCAGAQRSAASTPLPALRHELVCLVNRERAAHGLPALREDARLDRSAQSWTDHLVVTGQFTHGSDLSGRISAVGFPWRSAGENIASGFVTPAAVVRGWMGSSGHCANILDPQYSEVGSGAVARATGGLRFGSTWTQDFALGSGQRIPSGNWGPARGCPYAG